MIHDKNFFDQFLQEVERAYVDHSPGILHRTWVQVQQQPYWITFRFGICHPRGLDQVCIRFIGEDFAVDYFPGGTSDVSPLCQIDNYGLRWLFLNDSTDCFTDLGNEEKDQVEQAIVAISDVVWQHRKILHFLSCSDVSKPLKY